MTSPRPKYLQTADDLRVMCDFVRIVILMVTEP